MQTASRIAEIDEPDLIVAVLRRDRKATAEFVDRYADGVYSYVKHRLIPRADMVEDLVQDVFLTALGSLKGFRGDCPVQHWLLGIARHKVEDHYRRRLRDPLSLTEGLEGEPMDYGEAPRLDELLDDKRAAQRTSDILQVLPETYSLVLLWRYWENRSAREIAAEIGKSEKAVERTLARARAEFKRRWNRE